MIVQKFFEIFKELQRFSGSLNGFILTGFRTFEIFQIFKDFGDLARSLKILQDN